MSTLPTHPPGAVIQSRLLDNQEGANTEPHVFGKLSARFSQRRPLPAPTLLHLWRYWPWKIGPGRVWYTRAYCTVLNTFKFPSIMALCAYQGATAVSRYIITVCILIFSINRPHTLGSIGTRYGHRCCCCCCTTQKSRSGILWWKTLRQQTRCLLWCRLRRIMHHCRCDGSFITSYHKDAVTVPKVGDRFIGSRKTVPKTRTWYVAGFYHTSDTKNRMPQATTTSQKQLPGTFLLLQCY